MENYSFWWHFEVPFNFLRHNHTEHLDSHLFPFQAKQKAMEILCRIVQLSYHEYSLISYLSLYFFLNAHAHAYSSKVVSFNTSMWKKNNTEPTKNNRLKNLLLFIVLFGITLLQSATFVQSAKNINDAIILVVKQNILT